jgi:hypothetical protein
MDLSADGLGTDSPVATAPRVAMPQKNYRTVRSHCYLCTVERQGVPKTRAEIIPIEPDAGNADEGRHADDICQQNT